LLFLGSDIEQKAVVKIFIHCADAKLALYEVYF